MPLFQVFITQVTSTAECKGKYLIKLHQGSAHGGRFAITSFTDDTDLSEALAVLGFHEPQRQRILSELNGGHDQVFTVDISREVAQFFDWPEQE